MADETKKETGELRMLRADEVERMTGLSAVTIWRMEKRGDFPRRRTLVNQTVGWRSDEVQEWLESREPVPLKDED